MSEGPACQMLNSAPRVGVVVIATRRCQVRRSRRPLAGRPCLSWKPLTAAVVGASYTPVVVSGSQASWNSRCWSSRTRVPRAPGGSRTRSAAGMTACEGDDDGEDDEGDDGDDDGGD